MCAKELQRKSLPSARPGLLPKKISCMIFWNSNLSNTSNSHSIPRDLPHNHHNNTNVNRKLASLAFQWYMIHICRLYSCGETVYSKYRTPLISTSHHDAPFYCTPRILTSHHDAPFSGIPSFIMDPISSCLGHTLIGLLALNM